MSVDAEDESYIRQLIRAERLPVDFMTTVEAIYKPLAEAIAERAQACSSPLIVGINGAQGTGKSTLTRFLVALLGHEHGLKSAAFSIDDIYLTKQQRQSLAADVHPMLATRGVPGTHDLALGMQVVDRLLKAEPDQSTAIPMFDKALDDRSPESSWPHFSGRPAVIVIEGWCVGAMPQAPAALENPINELERREDPDGVWRRYVNRQLATGYREFFSLIDLLVYIPVPRWELVYEWRLLQEQKLRTKCHEQGLDDSAVMEPAEVARFVQFYERVTRHSLSEMAARADFVLTMEADHRLSAISGL